MKTILGSVCSVYPCRRAGQVAYVLCFSGPWSHMFNVLLSSADLLIIFPDLTSMCMFIAWGEIQEESFNEQEENNLHSLFCMNIRKSSLSAFLWVNPGTAQVMFLP